MSEKAARINVSQHKDVTIAGFTDSKILDEVNISELGLAITQLAALRDRPKLLLDFAAVDYLSSAALGMLINVNGKVKQANGQLRLASIKPQIMEVFEITQLTRVFRIGATREEALASFE